MAPPETKALLRRIMRLHQFKLAPVQRAIGNPYIKKEFRDHHVPGKANAQQYQRFVGAWKDYAKQLDGSADEFGKGRALNKEERGLLSKEQRQTLSDLRSQVSKI
jgi:hypothetical protein